MIFDEFQEMTSSTCSTHFKFFDAPSRKPSQTRTKIKSFSSQISTFSCPLTLISLLCVLSTFQCSPAIIKENTSPSENTNNNLNISKSRNMTYNMEVLVIVDETMTRVHGSNLTGYIHTLMNIVDEIFHHETLGIIINIVLRDEHFSSRVTSVTQEPIIGCGRVKSNAKTRTSLSFL